MKLDKYAVGQRYAKALFALADQEQHVTNIHEEMQALETIFNDNPKLGTVLTDTTLDGVRKRALLAQLSQSFSPLMQHFLGLVYDYQRMSEMPAIIAAFEELYDQKLGITHAKVTSAVALDDAQITKMKAAYANRFGLNDLMITNVVDPEIIGGVIIEADHQVIDGSVRHGLEQIQALLLK